jgi:hypothetical protein
MAEDGLRAAMAYREPLQAECASALAVKKNPLCFALTDNKDLPLVQANMKALSCFVGLA